MQPISRKPVCLVILMYMTRLMIILVTLFPVATVSVAQTSTIDSLLQVVYRAAAEKEQLKAILNLCEEYQSLHRDTLDHYSYKAREMAAKLGGKKEVALAEIAVANDYLRWGWIDSALATIEPVVRSNKVEIPAERPIYFKAARQQALYYGNRVKMSEALEILYKIVNEAEKYNDTMVVSSNMNTIASIAIARETPSVALQWLRRAQNYLSAGAKYDMVRAAVYVNFGLAYDLANQSDSAIYFSERGIQLMREKQNMTGLGISLRNQSEIYLKAGKTEKAEAALQEMISVREKIRDQAAFTDDHVALINFYITTEQIDKAIAYCKSKLRMGELHGTEDGIEITFTNNPKLRLQFYQLLAKCYKLKGDMKLYQETLEHIILAKDSLTDLQSEQAIAEMQTKYEVQKKENTIIQQELTIAQKNNFLVISLGIGCIVTITSYFFFRDYRKKQKLKMEGMVEEERKRIAADLHDNLGAYAASIASNLDLIKANGVSDENKSALDELNNNSQTMVAQLSDTIWVLNKDSLTLTAISDRVKIFLKRIRKSHGHIDMEVLENIEEDISIPPSQAFHLFQVVQEAVTNAVKHSGASRIVVEITGRLDWKVSVTDNGKGMRVENNKLQGGGNGLKNMRQRAAVSGWHIDWEAAEPNGTKLIIHPSGKK